MTFWARHAKAIALVLGFLSTLVGVFWSSLVASRQDSQVKRLSGYRAILTHQIERLNTLSSEYFLANQQGDMIFILSLQDNARADVAALVHKANILDRATPIRSMLAELALEGQLDYRRSYADYEKLSDRARADFSYPNYSGLKAAEAAIIKQGQDRSIALFGEIAQVESDVQTDESAQRRGQLIGFIASVSGSFLLLLANLSVEKFKTAI